MHDELVDRHAVGLPSPAGLGRGGHGSWPLQGAYWTPKGTRPTTALIATHFNLDFSEHYLAPLMARRGYGFLGWNTRFRGAEQYFLLDHAVAEIGEGVRWLREEAGVERVVLLGNSGGGSLMATYQSQAVAPSLEPAPGGRLCPAALECSPADLYISLAAHPGRPDLSVSFLDPSVTDEADPESVDPDLDMYDPRNGPPYSEEFQRAYRAAQLARNRRISAWARAQLQALADSPSPARDRLFVVHRLWADLRFVDGTIEPSSRPVPQCWLGDPRRANYNEFGIGTVNTLRTWLSMCSIDDSQCRIQLHGRNITVPSLVIGAAGDTGIFPGDTATIFDAIAATDKEAVTLETDHYLREPGTVRDEAADLIAGWVAAHT